MRKVEVCLTPDLIHQVSLKGKIAVVVDIFRATSCMVAGLANGVKAIKPVSSVEQCRQLGEQGWITAGERGGIKIDDFDLGNSPFDYLDEKAADRQVAVSTTNGTLAIEKSLGAQQILIGAFLNLQATANFINEVPNDVVIHCAGWKGAVNVEDTLYAGALIQLLDAKPTGDSALLAHHFYLHHQDNLLAIAKESGHAHRLAGFGIQKDLDYCMAIDKFDLVVKLENDVLTKI